MIRGTPFSCWRTAREQGAESLVLCRGSDLVLHGERGQESRDLGGAHFRGVPLAMEEAEPPDPVDVGFLGPAAVVPGADGLANPIEESRRAGSRRACFAHDPRRTGRRPVEETTSS
jgi:hypothetical protein